MSRSDLTLQRFVATLPQALLVVDVEGRVVAANQPAVDLCGRGGTSVVGRPLAELVESIPPNRLERLTRTTSGEAVPLLMRFRGENDHDRRLVCFGNRLSESGDDEGDRIVLRFDVTDARTGRFQGLIDTIQSLRSEIRRREERDAKRSDLLDRERRARATAELATRLKDDLLTKVSHELRTPLHAVLTWAELIRERVDDDQVREAVEAIRRNALAQTAMIDDLIDLSRLVRGDAKLVLEPLDLAGLVDAVVDMVRPAADAHAISFLLEFAPELPEVCGDADRIRQVLWHLLSNAVKFSPDGAEVHLEARANGGFVEVSVRDQGVGISQDLLPYVFDGFRQGEASSTRRHGGLGLGLAVVRRIVELHGGRASAHSAGPNSGACFTFTVPSRQRPYQAATSRPGAAPEVEASLVGMRVLLVDDHGDSRIAMERLLGLLGAEVEGVPSTAAAYAALVRRPPDVVISDLEMPEEDGFAFVQKLRRFEDDRLRSTPAVALTAYAGRHDRDRALAAGFDRYLSKPVERDELVAVLVGLTEP